MKKVFLGLLVVFTLALGACSPGSIPVTGETPGAVSTVVEGGADTAALVTQLIQERLATDLGVTVPDVQVTALEATEWQDSCLGLGGPEESCLQVVTPGFLASATVNGQAYEVHASQDGTVIRWK